MALLDGFHLVVNPKKDFQRQWQTVKEVGNDAESDRLTQFFIQSTL